LSLSVTVISSPPPEPWYQKSRLSVSGPVLAEREVANQGGLGAARGDRSAVEGGARDVPLVPIAGEAGLGEPEVEHEIVEPVAVHVVDVTAGLTGPPIHVGLGRVAET
jgi:hypothetical protein